MATPYQDLDAKRKPLTAKPRPQTDREQLRADIEARYDNTLRYLGR